VAIEPKIVRPKQALRPRRVPIPQSYKSTPTSVIRIEVMQKVAELKKRIAYLRTQRPWQ